MVNKNTISTLKVKCHPPTPLEMRDQFNQVREKEELYQVNTVALTWEATEITKLNKISQD